jgi:hypothetical protein
MVGGLAGAFRGASGIPARWREKAEANPQVTYRETLVPQLIAVIRRRAERAEAYVRTVSSLI